LDPLDIEACNRAQGLTSSDHRNSSPWCNGIFFYKWQLHCTSLVSTQLTVMVTVHYLCDMFSADLDVGFNTTKSVAMRIGPKCDAVCADLTLSGGIIQYVQFPKYLGVCIKTNRTFVCNFEHVEAKFYRTFNCMCAKSFAANSELITIELLRSCCLPILLYATESLVPRVCDIKSLNDCINTAVAKIFLCILW